MKSQKIILQLHELVNETKEKLPQYDIENILEFIDCDEWGLAYEILCSQIYEYEVSITREFYERIRFLGKKKHINPDVWQNLESLVH